MNTKIFKQMDDEWRWLPYPTSSSNFGDNGCGCCACTHVAIEQESKKNWTPENLRGWMIDQGFAVPGHGTEWQGIVETLKHIGHKEVVWIKSNDPISLAWKELDKGNRIGVLLVDDSNTPDGTYWTSSGHYVSFNKYWKDEQGRHWFNIKDSGTRGHDGEFCYEKSIKGALPQLYIVERLGDEPQPEPTPEPTPEPVKKQPYTGKYPEVKLYLEPGDEGENVTRLQNYLNWYTDGEFFKECGKADGVYGKNTLKWTNKMLTDFFGAAEADGKVGPKTIAKMKAYSDSCGPTPTPIPSDYTRMIDVSEFQGNIEWAKVKADGIQGVIIRVAGRGGEAGVIYDDTRFVQNIKGAYNAGLNIGIYFLTQAITAAEGKEEAQYAIKRWAATGIPISYPICIDSEDVSWEEKGKKHYGRANSTKLSKATRTTAIKAFAEECKRQGYDSMIYASTSWLYNQVDMNVLAPLMTVWCAEWNSSCSYTGKYIIWQYSSKGSVNGISGNCDMDKCYIQPKKKDPPSPSPSPTPTPSSGEHYPGPYPVVKYYLEPGDKGENVTRLQNYLNWYTDGEFFKECGEPDGVYGKNTLKYANKMLTDFFGPSEADGKVGNKTIAKMKEYTKPVGPTPPTPGGHYTGKYPEVRVKRSNAEVIANTIKWAKWIANDNRFHYGKGQHAHHNGCYFCGTQPASKKNSGIVDWQRTYCCNPFVGAAWAHGGLIPTALNMCSSGRSWDFNKGSGYDASSLFDKLGKPAQSKLKPGDVLCNGGHVVLYIGDGKIAEASGGDDNVRNSKGWNNSIHIASLDYSDFERVYRYNSHVDADIIIRHGECSDRVYKLQEYLNWYTNGEFFKECGPADGYYGDNTLKYTKRMQTDFFGAKEADGTVGNKTITKMKEYVKSSQTVTDQELNACKTQAEWMKNYKYEWENNPTIAKSKYKGTCVTYVACVLQRINYLKSGEAIWHDGKGHVDDLHPDKMTVMYLKGTIQSNKSNLKAGDIILAGDSASTAAGGDSHIMIFTGQWSGDDPIVWDNNSATRVKKGQAPTHTYSGLQQIIGVVRPRGDAA